MQQQCRKILTSGRQCGGVALRRKNYCYHHNDLKRRSSGLRSQIQLPTQTYDLGTIPVPTPPAPMPPVTLEFPEDPAAILTNIYRVTNLLVQGLIDRPTANSVTYGMQVCLTALGNKALFDPAQATSRSRSRNTDSDDDSDSGYSDPGSNPPTPVSRPISRVILTPDGDEIAPPVEILEDNEAEPIHHRLCPCLLCAEKYRNHPPELHHPLCQCGLCEEQEPEQSAEHSAQSTEPPNQGAHLMVCHPERTLSEAKGESKDLLLPEDGTEMGAPSLAQPKVGNDHPDPCSLIPEPCRPRIARAASLLSGSSTRDPLNRPWSVAEYTFGDAIRRHEAQYAARAAAALAVGIEPPPYQPFPTGLLRPGTPEHEEDKQMQQQTSEYWTEHFRKLIAERPDIQSGVPTDRSSSVGWEQYLDEEAANESPEP